MRQDIQCTVCGYETPAVEVGRVKSQGQWWEFKTQEEVDAFLANDFGGHECFESVQRGGRVNSVWIWGYDYEVPPTQKAYKTREACEEAVRDDQDGELPEYIWIREFEVVA